MSTHFLPHANLTVRVGCRFLYQAGVPVPLLLNLKPRRDPHQALLAEQLSFGANLPAEEFLDAHGNTLYRLVLPPGTHEIRHDALFAVEAEPDNHGFGPGTIASPADLAPEVLRYTLPSRYCDSDKLMSFAGQKFGQIERGQSQVQAISDWIHSNIEYRFASGRQDISASDVLQRGYGVCRDFAHLMVALCRALNIPARYVVGHLPDIGFIDPGSPMDFHAYAEVYMGGQWYTYDARFNVPRIGRIKISSGFDAVDGAFATAYGAPLMSQFEVWAYQVAPGTVSVGDPIDLTKRLDGTLEVRGLPASPLAA